MKQILNKTIQLESALINKFNLINQQISENGISIEEYNQILSAYSNLTKKYFYDNSIFLQLLAPGNYSFNINDDLIQVSNNTVKCNNELIEDISTYKLPFGQEIILSNFNTSDADCQELAIYLNNNSYKISKNQSISLTCNNNTNLNVFNKITYLDLEILNGDINLHSALAIILYVIQNNFNGDGYTLSDANYIELSKNSIIKSLTLSQIYYIYDFGCNAENLTFNVVYFINNGISNYSYSTFHDLAEITINAKSIFKDTDMHGGSILEINEQCVFENCIIEVACINIKAKCKFINCYIVAGEYLKLFNNITQQDILQNSSIDANIITVI